MMTRGLLRDRGFLTLGAERCGEETRRSPKYTVVSFRATDEEKEQLEKIADAAKVPRSTILRAALSLFEARCRANNSPLEY